MLNVLLIGELGLRSKLAHSYFVDLPAYEMYGFHSNVMLTKKPESFKKLIVLLNHGAMFDAKSDSTCLDN